ncbi:MAG: hypothetical protein ABIP55_08740, partial [Tepidisphaeraceae bacterium]
DRLQRRTKPDAPRWIEAISKTAFVSALIGGGIIVYLLVLQPRLHIWTVFGPWQPLAVVVEEQENRLKAESGRPPRIIADGKYRLASVLTFYRMPLDANPRDVVRYTTSQWVFGEQGLGYRFWSNQADWTGADAIYLATADKGVDPIRPWFESVQIVDDERLNGRKGYVVAVCRAMRAMPVSTTTAATTTTTRQAEQE